MGKREATGKFGENHIDWHSGYYGAFALEFMENDADLVYETEHQLNHDPIRVDLLVVKKTREVQIANELGKVFRGHNILEYKSEGDAISIDTVFKINGYAMLYKAYGNPTDSIKEDDITVTITRYGYPREAIKALRENGYQVDKVHKGIYMITGAMLFPTQIVVISQLDKELHRWMTNLYRSIDKNLLRQVIIKVRGLSEKQIRLYGNAYVNVLIEANRKEMDKLGEEEPDMGEYLAEMFKDEIEKGRTSTAARLLKRGKATIQEIAEDCDLSEEKVLEIARENNIEIKESA